MLRPLLSALLVLLISVQETKASHALGAELTYECLGNGVYKVRVAFYRDCGGTVGIGSIDTDVKINSSCFNTTLNLTLLPAPQYGPPFDQYLEGYEIPIYCSASNCDPNNPNSPNLGIQEVVFEGTVTLPDCEDYIFSYVEYSRSASIATLQNPDQDSIRVEAFLNSVFAPCNSSPQFDLPARGIICVNQLNTMVNTATDYDGDSLSYTLYAPLNGPSSSVTYQGGYSFNSPVNNSNFVFTNGLLDILPTEQTITVLGIKVEEWRNGTMIGGVMRDMQVTVVANCPQSPEGALDYTGGLGAEADSIYLCTSNTDVFNLDVTLDSIVPGLVYTIEASNLADFPGATFELDTNSLGETIGHSGHFQWIPQYGNLASQTLVFSAYDDNCPVRGYGTFSFTFYYYDLFTDNSTEVLGVACNDSIQLGADIASIWSPYMYEWENDSTESSVWAGEGEYNVTVTDNLGCVETDSFNVFIDNYPIADFSVEDVCPETNLNIDELSVNFADVGVTPLQLTDWTWDFGDEVGTSEDQNPVYSYDEAGNYTIWLVIENANGCLDSISADILVHPVPEMGATAADTCTGYSSTFINTTTIDNGVVADWFWDFDDNGETSTLQSPIYAFSEVREHNVSLTATSDQGCVSDTTFAVNLIQKATADFSYEVVPSCEAENFRISLTNESEEAASYLWDFVSSTDSTENPVYDTPDGHGPIITLFANSAIAGCGDTLIEDLSELWIGIDFDSLPSGNVITPNDDDINDCLAPFYDESYKDCYKLEVWTRWGRKVFDSEEAGYYCWGGTDNNGSRLASGIYFFVASVNSYTRSGSVNVLE